MPSTTNQSNENTFLGAMFASLLLCVLLCYVRWPVFELFHTHILGGIDADTNLYFWLVSTFPHNLIERGWFETNSFYPYSNTLAWSDNFLFPSTIFYFLNSIIGLNDIASWNLLIIISQFLNGFFVFILAKRLNANWSSALLIASIFIAVPFYAQNLGHPQLQFFYWIPLGFSVFLSLIDKPTWPKSVALALVVSLSFLTSVYYAFGLILLCGIYFLLRCLSKEIPSKQLVIHLFFSALFGSLLLSPFVLPYLKAKEQFGARALHEFYYFGLSALSFISSVPISKVYGTTSSLSHDEAHFGWGFISLLILIIGAKNLWKLSPFVLIFGILALIFSDPTIANLFEISRDLRLTLAILSSWLSLGVLLFYIFKSKAKGYTLLAATSLIIILITLGPLGYEEIGVPGVGVFRLFYEIFPGMDTMRAISRIAIISILLLCLSAIPKLNLFGKKILFLIPLLVLESSVTSFPLAPLPQSPKIFEKLKTIATKDDAILISPISGALDKNNQVISWSELATINSSYLVALRDTRPLLLNGYSGQRPKTIYDLPRILSRFPSQAALNKLLEFEKLKFLVVLGSKINGFSLAQYQKDLAELGSKVRVVAENNNDLIIELQHN